MSGLGEHAGLGAGRALAETSPAGSPGWGWGRPCPHLTSTWRSPARRGKALSRRSVLRNPASGSATPGAAPGPWVQHLPHSGVNPPKGGVPGRSRPPRVL